VSQKQAPLIPGDCKSCRWFMKERARDTFGLCRRFPAYARHYGNESCGEFTAHKEETSNG